MDNYNVTSIAMRGLATPASDDANNAFDMRTESPVFRSSELEFLMEHLVSPVEESVRNRVVEFDELTPREYIPVLTLAQEHHVDDRSLLLERFRPPVSERLDRYSHDYMFNNENRAARYLRTSTNGEDIVRFQQAVRDIRDDLDVAFLELSGANEQLVEEPDEPPREADPPVTPSVRGFLKRLFSRKKRNARVYCGDQYPVFEVHVNGYTARATFADELYQHVGPDDVLYYGERVLPRRRVSLRDLNFSNGTQVTIRHHLLFGGATRLVEDSFAPLAAAFEHLLSTVRTSLSHESLMSAVANDGVSAFLDAHEDRIKLVENVILLVATIYRRRSRADIVLAVAVFVKQCTGRSLVSDLLKSAIMLAVDKFLVFQFQSAEEVLESSRSLLDGYKFAKTSEFFKQLHRFCIVVLGVSIFDKVGIHVPSERMCSFAASGVDKLTWASVDLVHMVLDSIQFICERGYQCFKMGSFQPLFHSGRTYEIWFDEVRELRRLGKLMGNPQANGFTEEEFVMRLDKAIEQGRAIRRALATEPTEVKRYGAALLGEVETLRALHRMKQCASAARREPLGVLLTGGSSVMKSELANIIFLHYMKLFSLRCEEDNRYVRNFFDEFWAGYHGQQCVHLDDLAAQQAHLGLDPSICEMLQVINTTAYITNQADLEDKGKIPLMARLVTASTNTEDLNAPLYFNNALAIRRRLPIVVEVSIKPEFMKNGMVDSSRIPVVPEGEYLDVWVLKLKRITGSVDPTTRKQVARAQIVEEFGDIYSFLDAFSAMARKHAEVQTKAKVDRETMAKIVLCESCFRPEKKCTCVETQAMDYADIPPLINDLGEFEFERLPDESDVEFRQRRERFEQSNAGVDTTLQRSMEQTRRNIEPQQVASIRHAPDTTDFSDEQALHILTTASLIDQFDEAERQTAPPYLQRRCGGSVVMKMVSGNEMYYEESTGAPVERVRLVKAALGGAYVARGTTPAQYFPYSSLLMVFGDLYVARQGMLYVSGTAVVWEADPDSDLPSEPEYTPDVSPLVDWYAQWRLNVGRPTSRAQRVKLAVADWALQRYFRYALLQHCVLFLLQWWPIRQVVYWVLLWAVPRPTRLVIRFLGTRIQSHLTGPNVLLSMALFAGVAGVCWATMKVCQLTHSKRRIQHAQAPEEHESFPLFEKEFINKWDAKDIKVCDRPDLPLQVSWKGLEDDEVSRILSKSCVVFNGRFFNGTQMMRRVNRALCIGGHWYVTNLHGFPEEEQGTVEVTFGARGAGISATKTFPVSGLKRFRVPGTDILFVQILGIPARRDITGLFPPVGVDSVGKGFVLVMNADGSAVSQREIVQCRVAQNVSIGGSVSMTVEARCADEFVRGECGSPYVVRTHGAVAIMGIHYYTRMDSSQTIGALLITQREIQQWRDFCAPTLIQPGDPLLVQCDAELDIGPLREKSHVSFIESGSAIVYGTSKGFRSRPKSTVHRTCIYPTLYEAGYRCEFGAPAMNWRSYHKALVDMTQTNSSMSDVILEECVSAFVADVAPYCDAEKFPAIKTSRKVSINGQDGVAYVDAMNRRTSAGAPFRKNKKHYMIEMDGEWDLTCGMHAVCDEYERRYQRGITATPIYATAQKDEPKALEKCADGARIFVCSSLPWAVVVRQYTLWFIRLVQNNRLPFELAVGVNPMSVEWGVFQTYLTQWGDDRIVAGDFKAYDKRMGANVILHAFEFVRRVARLCGGDGEMDSALSCIAEDVAFSFVDFDGDIIQFLGSNPSGHPLTVIVNCLVNSLYARYAYVEVTQRPATQFKSDVNYLTYGDDNIMNVSPDCEQFNHTTIQACYAKLGITYTMADKTAESVPFISLSEASFLKRAWEFRDGRWMAPLDPISIVKMLMIHTKSGSLCEEAQTVAAMGSAVREAAYHGEKFYNDITSVCKRAVAEHGLEMWVEPSTFPSYRAIMERWDENSREVIEAYESRGGVPGWRGSFATLLKPGGHSYCT